MRKYFDFIGSASLCCFIMPMYLFVSNYPQFGLVDTLLIVATFLGIFACITVVLGFIFRDIDRVLFFMYGLGIIFWFSRSLVDFLRQYFPIPTIVYAYRWYLFLFGCFLVAIFFLFVGKYLLRYTEKFLTIFALLISAIISINGCWKIFSNLCNTTSEDVMHDATNKIKSPNVYHILLDAHPNQKAMETIGGDLKPFYRELENLGFITFPESRSNYPFTLASVASMLNMDYLSCEKLINQSVSFFVKQIHNSEVIKNFKKHDYQVRIVTTSYPVVNSLYKGAVIKNRISMIVCQLHAILLHTPLYNIFVNLLNAYHTNDTNDIFLSLEKETALFGTAGNVFYYHALPFHNAQEPGDRSALIGIWENMKIDRVITTEALRRGIKAVYDTDALVLECIRRILSQYDKVKTKPIIVLHSDHSILYGFANVQDPRVNTDTVYGNLLALYVPEEWKSDAKNLTFINLYRWIFNHLFGQNYPYFKENRQIK